MSAVMKDSPQLPSEANYRKQIIRGADRRVSTEEWLAEVDRRQSGRRFDDKLYPADSLVDRMDRVWATIDAAEAESDRRAREQEDRDEQQREKRDAERAAYGYRNVAW